MQSTDVFYPSFLGISFWLDEFTHSCFRENDHYGLKVLEANRLKIEDKNTIQFNIDECNLLSLNSKNRLFMAEYFHYTILLY